MVGLIDAICVCLFPDDWEHGTALHCVFGYCPARARSLPEFAHYFLNAPKL
jgi:hypothetical protein